MTTIELAPVFCRAAEVIERNGHCKKSFYAPGSGLPPEESAVCAVGALCVALGCMPSDCDHDPAPGGWPLPREAVKFLSARVYSSVYEDPIERVADWNDAPERTPAEVMQALREAAVAAEAVRAA